jgi:hypothetical protein
MGPKVFTKNAAYDNIKPIKYNDMFEVTLTLSKHGIIHVHDNLPIGVQRFCWNQRKCAACVYGKGQMKRHSPWAQMH